MVAREILIKGKEGPTPISEQLTKQSTSTSRSVSVADDDIFKVPDIPARSQGPDDIPDIAKELEKANKAVRQYISQLPCQIKTPIDYETHRNGFTGEAGLDQR